MYSKGNNQQSNKAIHRKEENTNANLILDKGLISRIYKELLELKLQIITYAGQLGICAGILVVGV